MVGIMNRALLSYSISKKSHHIKDSAVDFNANRQGNACNGKGKLSTLLYDRMQRPIRRDKAINK
jgi:hypothetical protein